MAGASEGQSPGGPLGGREEVPTLLQRRARKQTARPLQLVLSARGSSPVRHRCHQVTLVFSLHARALLCITAYVLPDGLPFLVPQTSLAGL